MCVVSAGKFPVLAAKNPYLKKKIMINESSSTFSSSLAPNIIGCKVCLPFHQMVKNEWFYVNLTTYIHFMEGKVNPKPHDVGPKVTKEM